MSSMRRGVKLTGAVALSVTAVLAMAAEEPPVPPPAGEVISVTTFDDTAEPDVINNCVPSANPAYDIECPTLREAVMYANGSEVPSMDTIMLSAGTYTLTATGHDETFAECEVPGQPDAPAVTNVPNAGIGDLDITDSLIIKGAGPDMTIVEWADWGPEPVLTDRVFHVYDPLLTVFAEFDGISVRNGMLLEQELCQGPPTTVDPVPDPELDTIWVGRRAGGGIAVGPAANTVLVDPNKTGVENSAGRGGSQKPDDPGDELGGTYIDAQRGRDRCQHERRRRWRPVQRRSADSQPHRHHRQQLGHQRWRHLQ